MNWHTLKLLYVHEMRLLLRSRRTIVTSIVIPAVMMPLMIIGVQSTQRRSEDRMNETVFRYSVAGPWREEARILIDAVASLPEYEDFQVQEIASSNPAADLEAGRLHFYLQTLAEEEASRSVLPATSPTVAPADRVVGVPAVQVIYRGNQDLAGRGARRMIEMLRAARRNESYSRLLVSGFPSHPEGILAMTAQNIATESQVSGSYVGRFFTLVLLMWMTAAGSIAAMDILAGEKERGTLETLITSAAGRAEIATAKQLTICTVALAITLVQTLNALFYIKADLIAVPEGFDLSVSLTT